MVANEEKGTSPWNWAKDIFEHFSANRYLVYIKRPLFEAISVWIKHRRPCTQLISRSVNQDSTCQKGKKGPQLATNSVKKQNVLAARYNLGTMVRTITIKLREP